MQLSPSSNDTMRGNWETSEIPAHVPAQQQEQQQQSIVAEQGQAHDTPTTPAWSTGVTVKTEPTGEKDNNDSGVSPDHYTSNTSTSSRSGASTSTANCSLSPVSANSQDMTMQCSSPPPAENPNSPANDEEQDDKAVPSTSGTQEQVPISLQCPVCRNISSDRLDLTVHLASHCTAQSDRALFVSAMFEYMTTYGQTRNQADDEREEEAGLYHPKLNSQGKVKVHKCKQCPFMSVTKAAYWTHYVDHIRQDKVLSCKMCPFVTEYKHHLEYHLRNHYRSKPFKCDQCDYACVNKSMLNSHLKSHSSVYQYRCANCTYETKYCHSVKLHLRKYRHQPAMVLNADGTPNPLPIIDVYGKRRGPKARPKRQAKSAKTDSQTVASHSNDAGMSNDPAIPSTSTAYLATESPARARNLPAQTITSGMIGVNNMSAMGDMSAGSSGISAGSSSMTAGNINMGAGCSNMAAASVNMGAGTSSMSAANNTTAQHLGLLAMRQTSTALNYSYPHMYPAFPMMPHLQTETSGTDPSFNQMASSILMGYLKLNNSERMPEQTPQDLARNYNGYQAPSVPYMGVPYLTEVPTANDVQMDTSPMRLQEYEEDNEAPLDLSLPNTSKLQESSTAANSSKVAEEASRTPKTKGTSRRKGKAVKLQRRVVEADTDDVHPLLLATSLSPATSSRANSETGEGRQASSEYEEGRQSGPENGEGRKPGPKNEERKRANSENEEGRPSTMRGEFFCQFCEIAFCNLVMYTVHMGYHGYDNPFKCNMCGHESDDKVTFFLHIARSKHA